MSKDFLIGRWCACRLCSPCLFPVIAIGNSRKKAHHLRNIGVKLEFCSLLSTRLGRCVECSDFHFLIFISFCQKGKVFAASLSWYCCCWCFAPFLLRCKDRFDLLLDFPVVSLLSNSFYLFYLFLPSWQRCTGCTRGYCTTNDNIGRQSIFCMIIKVSRPN